jgi:cytochrome oxidase Cu insertion factor (SCO1/SenC/PrrC family)
MKSQRLTKIFILAGIFLIPAFFILLFRSSKANFEKLQYYGDHRLITSVVDGKEVLDTNYYTLPDFTLTNHLGENFTEKNIAGKIVVVNIIHANCPSNECNMDFLSFKKFVGKEVQHNKKFKDIEIISCFLPKVDSMVLKEMNDFIEFHEIDTDKWHILTGDMAQFYDTDMRTQNPWTAKDTDFGFENLAQVMTLLIDRNKHIRGKYISVYTSEIKRITKEISILLREERDGE